MWTNNGPQRTPLFYRGIGCGWVIGSEVYNGHRVNSAKKWVKIQKKWFFRPKNGVFRTYKLCYGVIRLGWAGFGGWPIRVHQTQKFEPFWGSIGHFWAQQGLFSPIWRIWFLRGFVIFSQESQNFILTAPLNAGWVRSIRSTPHKGYLRCFKMAEKPVFCLFVR